jgi:16S rRNA (uracil1498-N3)-methyltransferase
MRRFYVPPPQISGMQAALSAEEARHLRDVLRLSAGTRVAIFDGEGREFLCEITALGKKGAELNIIEPVEPAAPESPLHLSLAAAITKGDKFDLVIQKAAELGVTRFQPLITARCEVKLKDSGRRMERWQKIIIEASKQCGRATLMRIDEPRPLAEVLANADTGKILFFSESGGTGIPAREKSDSITAVVGPEGGWESSEVDAARSAGAEIVTLRGRVLRAETAAIAIAAIIQHRFGDLS